MTLIYEAIFKITLNKPSEFEFSLIMKLLNKDLVARKYLLLGNISIMTINYEIRFYFVTLYLDTSRCFVLLACFAKSNNTSLRLQIQKRLPEVNYWPLSPLSINTVYSVC